MMEEKYLICEDSLEGIFTGIYEAYALREGHEHVHIQIGEEENFRLFAVYLHIMPDPVKTEKVVQTLRSRLGEHVYHTLCRAAASCYPDKGEAVYRTVVDGLTAGSGRRVLGNFKTRMWPDALSWRASRRTKPITRSSLSVFRSLRLKKQGKALSCLPESDPKTMWCPLLCRILRTD